MKFGLIRLKDKDSYSRYLEMTKYLNEKGFHCMEKREPKKTPSLLDIERGKSAEVHTGLKTFQILYNLDSAFAPRFRL